MKRRNVRMGFGVGARARLAAVALLALGAGGCDWWYYKTPQVEALWYKIPWLDHMINARYVRPYETDSVVRYTPAGTVPVGETEPDWVDAWVRGDTARVNAIQNPYAKSSVRHQASKPQGIEIPALPRDVAAAGDSLYGTFCAVCHGAAGDGKGPVGPLVFAPSLVSATARSYSDGYIYGIIRYGRGTMPRYGDKVYNADDRWAIVNHVRKLQSDAPPPGPNERPTPAPPGPSLTGSTGAFPQ